MDLSLNVPFGGDAGLGGRLFAYHCDLYGHLVTRYGYGGYVLIPGSFDRNSRTGDENLALGDIDIGGLFVRRRQRVEFVVRGGLTLPTASDAVGRVVWHKVVAVFPRLTDLATVYPVVWLRLAGSVIGASGKFFYRADAGIDIPVWYDDDFFTYSDPDPLGRLNLGVGMYVRSIALTAELVNLGTRGRFFGSDEDEDPSGDQHLLHNLALSVRYVSPTWQPSATFVVSLGNNLPGRNYASENSLFDFGLMVMFGLERVIGPPGGA